MSSITAEQAIAVFNDAELLCTPQQVEAAFAQMATAITQQLANCDPLILIVMNGAFLPAAQLVSRLRFPLRIGYPHASRYRGATRGGEIEWIAPPRPAVAGQTVLVVDDIFDEGYTLQAILTAVRQQGATAVYSAALVNKQHNRKVPGLTVDFIGLESPDRYVFGCGMDYKEYWRNLPAIYAARN